MTVSVIMPVYNGEKRIKQAVQSVENQKYQDFELIIIDDGSEDRTLEIIRTLEKQYTNIVVCSKSNGGPASARNYGLKKARGEYVAFIDADDCYARDFLSAMVGEAEEKKADWIMCGYQIGGENVRKKRTIIPQNLNLIGDKEINANLGMFIKLTDEDHPLPLFNSLWNKLYRMNIIKGNNIEMPVDLFMGEDFCFNVHYLAACYHIVTIAKPLYRYCLLNDSITTSFRENEFAIRKESIKVLNAFCQERGLVYDVGMDYLRMAYSCLANLHLKSNKSSRRQNDNERNKIINDEDLRTALNNMVIDGVPYRFLYLILKYRFMGLIKLTSWTMYFFGIFLLRERKII